MAKDEFSKAALTGERLDYSKIGKTMPLPNLLDFQRKAYDWFMKEGIYEAFHDIFPIESQGENYVLEFVDLKFLEPKHSVENSKDRYLNYAYPMRATLRLINNITGEIKESEVFFGEMPAMLDSASFIIGGNEKVIVPQLSRSPGAYFSSDYDKRGRLLCLGEIHPMRGAWLEFESDSYEIFHVRIDRERKIPATTILRAIGLEDDQDILDLFGDMEQIKSTLKKDSSTDAKTALFEIHSKLRPGEPATIEGARNLMTQKYFDPKRFDLAKAGRFKLKHKLGIYNRLRDKIIAQPLVDENGEVVYEEGTLLDKEKINFLKKKNFFENGAHSQKVKINENLYIDKEKADTVNIVSVYKGKEKDEKVKIIGNDLNSNSKALNFTDIIALFSFFTNNFNGFLVNDDIDFLGNRRIKSIGELVQNTFRSSLSKMEKGIKEKMSISETSDITPRSIVNVRPLTTTLGAFFSYSQLSHFMDQANPLSEVSNKRRISALGPGGLNKERAGVDVRDVHYSHYGRICPVETPEGGNIGLISNLSTYARLDEYGFIQTPYRKVDKEKGVVTSEYVYLSAFEEDEYILAQASVKLDDKNKFIDDKVIARKKGETVQIDKEKVDFVDVSPKQLISISTACIPFLENTDAHRTLMAANMQRQAIPLIKPKAPLVGTGVEKIIADTAGFSLLSNDDGIVSYVDAKKVEVETKNKEKKIYRFKKFAPSNDRTCLNHIPRVSLGDKVKKGDVLADGGSVEDGELALGQNVRLAFMTWGGYNYEDAIIISDRLFKEDVYTSIHIENYTLECRDTKLGPEEITRDVPNVSEDAKGNLDIRGIVIPGTKVKEGDILVGKVTPKGQSEPSPEEKLLMAIFGEKTKEGKDKSLRVPHGGEGIVLNVKYFSRKNGDTLKAGVNEMVRVYVAQKRKISEGDKMAGRHGNKGVISKIIPQEDMPFTPEGEPIDVMLNPLGVPSRMNIGQIFELHVGLAAEKLGIKVSTPVFEGIGEKDLKELFKAADLSPDLKTTLYDGRSGEAFDARVSVGNLYLLKLSHMVDDKLHARATGPYSLVTQQPLGGKAQNGGQRFGEMEVWALETYGAAHTLQEMLTIKSDDVVGRAKTYQAILKGKELPTPCVPESFKVLQKELQALAIDVEVFDVDGEIIDMKSATDYQQKEEKKLQSIIRDNFSSFKSQKDSNDEENE